MTIEQYDPFLIEIAKMLDPGRWWSEGATGYVASMYDSRSFEDRSIAAVKNAERLVLHIAGEIVNEAPLSTQLENAINVRIGIALEEEAEKRGNNEANLREEIEDLKRQLEEAKEPKASATSFLDLAGAGDDIFEEDTPFGKNPLIDDLVRAAPLSPRRDVALVDVGPEAVGTSMIPVLEEKPAASQPMPVMLALVAALRRAQYMAEPIGFEFNATIRVNPAANRDDSIATIDLTVEAKDGEARVSRETVWLNPDRPTDKYDQVFAIVQSSSKDAGRHIRKLFT